MKKEIILLAIVMTTQLCSAQNVVPTFGINATKNILDRDGIATKGIALSSGVELNHRTNFTLDLTYVIGDNRHRGQFDTDKMNGLMGSASIAYRLIEAECKLSPLIGFTVGTGMTSKSKVELRRAQDNQAKLPSEVLEHDFDVFGFYVSGKFMLDLRLKNISLRLGPTYSLFQAKRYVSHEQEYSNKYIRGLGLEMGLVIPLSPRSMRSSIHIPSRNH